MIKSQKGFTAVEGILIFVILAIIGGTGYFVLHSKQVADNTLAKTNPSSITAKKISRLGGDCTTKSPLMKGKTYKAFDGSISFCLPNGWVLNGAGTLAAADWYSGENPTYKSSAMPQLIRGGGTDGIKPLFINSVLTKDDAEITVDTSHKVGVISAKNSSGFEYQGTQSKIPGDGDFAPNPGTVEHMYALISGKRHITFEYFVLDGATDNSSQVKAVVQTVTIN